MSQKKMNNTKLEILQCATKLFLEKGYTETYVTTISNTLNISTGNLTFHFPTKEHILAELVKQLCEYQKEFERKNSNEITSHIFTYLAELVMFASVSSKNSNVQDLMLAAYTHPLSVEIIRKNDTGRAVKTFGEYCPEWEEADYILAENIVFGIEYSMFRQENTDLITFEQRVSSCMEAIMKIYEVPRKIREQILGQIMVMDYWTEGSLVFEEFCKYVEAKIRGDYKET